MAPWRPGRDKRSAADPPASALDAECAALTRFVRGRSDLGISADEVATAVQFLQAVGPRRQLAVIESSPWLAGERGMTVLRHLREIAATHGLSRLVPPILEAVEWVTLLLEVGARPERWRLPDD